MKKMKKVFAAFMAVLMTIGVFNISASAEEVTEAEVYVTIADENGELALTQEKVTVTDIDNDGVLTINDALYAAHEAKYEGGAEAGYTSYYGQYGLALDKLWGTENGGSYGYWVNNQSAWSLADTVKEGDYINAFVYTDLTAWSDTYSFFDAYTVTGTVGKEIALVLSKYVYDADWNRVLTPVEGATIIVDGKATEVKTDAEGKATIKIEEGGSYVISATSDTEILVPPVCKITVSAEATTEATAEATTEATTETITEATTEATTEAAEQTTEVTTEAATETTVPSVNIESPLTGDCAHVYMFILTLLALSALMVVFSIKNKGNGIYEK